MTTKIVSVSATQSKMQVNDLDSFTFDSAGNLGVASLNGGQLGGFRNRIINGGVDIAQRGTSSGLDASWAYRTVDRWGIQGGATGGFTSRATDTAPGCRYAATVGRANTATNTTPVQIMQCIESGTAVSLRGQTVILSAYVRKGTGYSGGNLSISMHSGTGVDESLFTANGSYTGNQTFLTSAALLSTYTRVSLVAVMPTDISELSVTFGYVPTGTASLDDCFYISGVQLEVTDPANPKATPFEQRPYGMELALCQRYYWKTEAAGTGGSGLIYGISTQALVTVWDNSKRAVLPFR